MVAVCFLVLLLLLSPLAFLPLWGDALGFHCWGRAVWVQDENPAPRHPQPLLALHSVVQQLPCTPSPGQSAVQDAARAALESQCCSPAKPSSPA